MSYFETQEEQNRFDVHCKLEEVLKTKDYVAQDFKYLDENTMKELVHSLLFSKNQLATIFHCSPSTIFTYLKKNGANAMDAFQLVFGERYEYDDDIEKHVSRIVTNIDIAVQNGRLLNVV